MFEAQETGLRELNQGNAGFLKMMQKSRGCFSDEASEVMGRLYLGRMLKSLL